MTIQYTTKETTRFRLDADCYGHAGGGYQKKGEFIEVPEGTPVSQTWTEVDDDGEPVPGGFKSRRIPRAINRPKGSENKSLVDIANEAAAKGDEGEDDEPEEAAPTPPAAPAKTAPAAKKPKPAAPAKTKHS